MVPLMGTVHGFHARPAMYCAGRQPLPDREATATFSFTLPAALVLRVQPGRWQPCIHGVRVDVGAGGEVTIGGYDGSEQCAISQVWEQALRFLDSVAPRSAGTMMPAAIVAELKARSRPRPQQFQIIFNARVSIAARERWYLAPTLI